MAWFLGLGSAGVVLLALSLVFDGVLDGVLDGAPDGVLDGWLSLPVVAGFLAMTGFTGAIVLGAGWSGPGGATAAGVLAGAGTGWAAYRLSRALMRDRSAVAPAVEQLLGTPGKVVTAIPADGFGEVLLHLGGQPLKCAARSAEPLARGTRVWVEATPTATSVLVRPVDD
jgi:membrane-bound ClpP family serine protease